jgi:hypothetical protein
MSREAADPTSILAKLIKELSPKPIGNHLCGPMRWTISPGTG